ncbi:hypothetical protein, partial [Xanthomonas euvesicatoria]|uniref:hypothetical protein n=1 Tax=Xanthomonas euvesicatoria TaxID=456327 RepID=UPI001C47DD8C
MQQRAMRVAQAPHRGFGRDRHGELIEVVSHRQQLAVANQALVVMLSTPRNSMPAKTRGLRLMLITELSGR